MNTQNLEINNQLTPEERSEPKTQVQATTTQIPKEKEPQKIKTRTSLNEQLKKIEEAKNKEKAKLADLKAKERKLMKKVQSKRTHTLIVVGALIEIMTKQKMIDGSHYLKFAIDNKFKPRDLATLHEFFVHNTNDKNVLDKIAALGLTAG